MADMKQTCSNTPETREAQPSLISRQTHHLLCSRVYCRQQWSTRQQFNSEWKKLGGDQSVWKGLRIPSRDFILFFSSPSRGSLNCECVRWWLDLYLTVVKTEWKKNSTGSFHCDLRLLQAHLSRVTLSWKALKPFYDSAWEFTIAKNKNKKKIDEFRIEKNLVILKRRVRGVKGRVKTRNVWRSSAMRALYERRKSHRLRVTSVRE